MTPRQIVAELDQHIVGQAAAKRAVAIAVRNRWRWSQLDDALRREVTPKNIIMIGPTGVGKTEITRRLAKILRAPFVKVEATKYTEVGYHGRDVDSMVRDLADAAATIVKIQQQQARADAARQTVDRRLVEMLLASGALKTVEDDAPSKKPRRKSKHPNADSLLKQLKKGELDELPVEIRVDLKAVPVHMFSNMGLENMDVDFQNLFDRLLPKNSRSRVLPVREAREVLLEQEYEALLDKDAWHEETVRLAEHSGIIFLDELDKICGPDSTSGPDVSRQGVQRDLLPIVEGTTVQTRYGPVRTDHVLFIAAGAFHKSKPSDLMPELQGRFPIRVELQDLTRDDFTRILNEPSASLVTQYQALLAADGVTLTFTHDGLEAIAEIAYQVNQTTQNIGARRLHTIMERLTEDFSFEAPYAKAKSAEIDADFVRGKLQELVKDEDLSRFIL